MASQLPEFPSLDLLRKRAKRLVRAASRGDGAALERCRAAVPRLADLDDDAARAAVRLADAQHALARELGAASWPKLKQRIESLQPVAVQAERLLAAVRQRRPRVARRLLRQNPALAGHDIFTACAAAAEERVAAALGAEPGLAGTAHAPDGWAPLIYVGASPFAAAGAKWAGALGRCAELLLAHGADPNACTVEAGAGDGGTELRLPALYYACAGGQARVARRLLERGADPNDGESIFHAAEGNHRECLEVLVAQGADPSGRHPHWKNTPLFFLAGYRETDPSCASSTAGMQWLLEHGADPNVTSSDAAETPLHRIAALGRATAVAELLLAHGAAIDQPRADGRTAYALALRTGHAEMADFLRSRGAAAAGLTPGDELLAACMTANATAADIARSLLARHPDLLAALGPEERQALITAVEEGREASVRLMAGLGFDLRWEGSWAGTPLHHAAWRGRPAMVRLLLELGAPLDARDSQFGSSPLGWAAHGSSHHRRADDDYCAVVEALLDAGADREASVNRWGEAPAALASRRVAALLKRRQRLAQGDDRALDRG
jgi:ankyrin repeat protein